MPRRLTEEEEELYQRGIIEKAQDEVSQADMGLSDVPVGERDYIALIHDICLMAEKGTDVPIQFGRRLYHFLDRDNCPKCGETFADGGCKECGTKSPDRLLDDTIFNIKRGAQVVGRAMRAVHNWDPLRRWVNQSIDSSLSIVSGRVAMGRVIQFRRLYKRWKRDYGMKTLGKKIKEEGMDAADKEYLKDTFMGSLEWLQENYPMSKEDLVKANENCFNELVDELDAARTPIDDILSRQMVTAAPWTPKDKARTAKAKHYRLEL